MHVSGRTRGERERDPILMPWEPPHPFLCPARPVSDTFQAESMVVVETCSITLFNEELRKARVQKDMLMNTRASGSRWNSAKGKSHCSVIRQLPRHQKAPGDANNHPHPLTR